mmetsp:Transcript_42242/g.76563  ORF Transcript_42242/g.76563 Transcript_42242/m.76563 type:complete len:241 (-) Transcript_42242:178-900(-)
MPAGGCLRSVSRLGEVVAAVFKATVGPAVPVLNIRNSTAGVAGCVGTSVGVTLLTTAGRSVRGVPHGTGLTMCRTEEIPRAGKLLRTGVDGAAVVRVINSCSTGAGLFTGEGATLWLTLGVAARRSGDSDSDASLRVSPRMLMLTVSSTGSHTMREQGGAVGTTTTAASSAEATELSLRTASGRKSYTRLSKTWPELVVVESQFACFACHGEPAEDAGLKISVPSFLMPLLRESSSFCNR